MGPNISSVLHGYSRQKEEEQAKAVAAENNLPYINLVNYSLTGDILGILPPELSTKFQIVAFQRVGNTVRVATPYPHQAGLAAAMNEIGEKDTVTFLPYVCSDTSIKFALAELTKLVAPLTDDEPQAKTQSIHQFISRLSSLNDLAGVLQATSTTELFETILSGALAFQATDIHFEPQRDNIRVRFRVDGDLIKVTEIDPTAFHLLLSRVKNLAKLKLNRLSGPQDGRFTLKVGPDNVDIRVSVLPATYGETIELRLLTGRDLLSLEKLGLNETTTAAIKRAITQKNGLIIVTGPTGSGKTTTLYSILQLLNQPDKKIITIEDPVEYKIAGIEQIQVNPKDGFDFAEALRGVLRQDPDVVLVGEIRDKETADIALNAALTGHLVLTTLHTNNAPATFARLMEMGVSPYLLNDAIRLILAQRLVKRICPICHGAGGPECNQTGHKGRLAISEALEPTPEFGELIKKKATISEFTALFKQQGNKSFQDDFDDRVKAGEVAESEERATK